MESVTTVPSIRRREERTYVQIGIASFLFESWSPYHCKLYADVTYHPVPLNMKFTPVIKTFFNIIICPVYIGLFQYIIWNAPISVTGFYVF